MNFATPEETGFTIYSKSGCINCVKVKTLLKEQKEKYITIDCDEYLLEDKPAFLHFIHLLVGKEYKTFPMVFLNGKFLGGYQETEEYFSKKLDFSNDF
jgi:glutaredoxin